MSDRVLDIVDLESVPEDAVETAMRKALADAEVWQYLLESGAEEPDILLSPGQLGFIPGALPSCEAIAEPSPEDDAGSWAFGLAGHGIGNIYFCCKLRFPKLRAAVSIPHSHPFDTPQEEAQDDRQSLRAVCGMMAFLLRHAIAKLDFAHNNPDACLTVVCDRGGSRYLICDASGTIAEGTSWKTLLEEYFNPDFDNPASLQIFRG